MNSADLKVAAILVGLLTSVISVVWYAAVKSNTIDEQEKHIEFNDARMNGMDARIRSMENDIIRLQDKVH